MSPADIQAKREAIRARREQLLNQMNFELGQLKGQEILLDEIEGGGAKAPVTAPAACE